MEPVELIRQLRAERTGRVVVGFVGSRTRTRRIDIERLYTIMESILHEELGDYLVISGGKCPFDHYVENLAVSLDLEVYQYGPDSLRARLVREYERPVEMAEILDLLIAFPKEGYGADEADLRVVEAAAEDAVPIITMTRDGEIAIT